MIGLNLYESIVVLFIITQGIYFVNNLGVISLYLKPKEIVPTREPDEYPHVNVLIAAYKERREIIEDTLEDVHAADYPADRVTAYLIYEENDDVIGEYASDLDIETVLVKEDDPVWERIEQERGKEAVTMPRNKARALTYTLYTRDFEGIVTVLDADTRFDPGLFKHGVVGLEDYDIVQAKQTVRNIGDGWLPMLESMGVATWCKTVYERTSTKPYQLLGKAYFLRAEDLYELGGWNPYTITEDMYLGIEAYKHGFSHGIIDVYIEDLCPKTLDAWLTQKTRWVHGPYEVLTASLLNWREKLQFMNYTVTSQIISMTNIIGVPVGIAVLVLTLLGSAPALPLVVTGIVTANLLVWLHHVYRSYSESRRAIDFESTTQAIKYYSLSNILTQLLYATLWTFPILFALKATIQKRTLTFEVTPK